MRSDDERYWKLFARALDILDHKANGAALPILRKLAARRFAPAVTILSDYIDAAQAIVLLRRATRLRDGISAYNLAITHRNMGNMFGYRHSLAFAARLDDHYRAELKQFLTRFPEQMMRRFGRLARDKS